MVSLKNFFVSHFFFPPSSKKISNSIFSKNINYFFDISYSLDREFKVLGRHEAGFLFYELKKKFFKKYIFFWNHIFDYSNGKKLKIISIKFLGSFFKYKYINDIKQDQEQEGPLWIHEEPW